MQFKANFFRHRVLVVDDDRAIREIMKAILEAQGYEVLGAADGFEAILTLKQALPDFIISDLGMPNMNGFEFLSVVRKRFPSIPVVVISAEFSGLSVPQNVLADAFFPKAAFKHEDLFTKMIELLEQIPHRAKPGSKEAAVWVMNNKGLIAVTCTQCLRTFPVFDARKGINEGECDFCSAKMSFEVALEGPYIKSNFDAKPIENAGAKIDHVAPRERGFVAV